METIRLTAAQAIVRYLQAQKTEVNGELMPVIGGVFAIFGHGNVAGLGEALEQSKATLPTFRAHNEQAMALAAAGYAKQYNRRRLLAATTSIGPGATNLVTAAGMAMANRLPLLLLPGDTFSSRAPDPVLQQIENPALPGQTVNDCLQPVSRYFDRIHRPEQLITSLPAAMRILMDPADTGPVTLALPQDVQTMAFDYPLSLFEDVLWLEDRQPCTEAALSRAAELICQAERPVIIAGGGVKYSNACKALQEFVELYDIPVAETQAGKGCLPWNHPQQLGAVGVTGSKAANDCLQEADLVIAIGTRLQDFTTGSRSLYQAKTISINIATADAWKHGSVPLKGDCLAVLRELSPMLLKCACSSEWVNVYQARHREWMAVVDNVLSPESVNPTGLPTDANVIGAVLRASDDKTTVVCAAGGLPGELHKLWRAENPLSYHLEYGFSCMGYEIAGALGAKMATPEREIIVTVGDGSYLMMNSEIATSVMLGMKLIIVVLDNRGYACINRLQQACGGAPFNNLLENCLTVEGGAPKTDFAAHAKALGANSEYVASFEGLKAALERAKASDKTYVISLDTDSHIATDAGGHWWEVAVPEVSARNEVNEAREGYEQSKQQQPYGL